MKKSSLLLILLLAVHSAAALGQRKDDVPDSADDDPEDPSDALPAVPVVHDSEHPRKALLAEAHRELAALTESHYAHHTHVEAAQGIFDYDCSGFVGYALARVAPGALRPVVAATRSRPLAKDFEAFFAAPQAPWTRVVRAGDLIAGDVIAWLEPPAMHSRNTGHVMIVESAPRPSKHPHELIVRVIDSSHSHHGTADARYREHRNGLGTGDLILLTDEAGQAIGYRWSLSKKSIAYRTTVELGHLP